MCGICLCPLRAGMRKGSVSQRQPYGQEDPYVLVPQPSALWNHLEKLYKILMPGSLSYGH